MLVPVGLLEVLGGLLEVLDCWHGCWRWWQGCRRVVLGLLGVVRVAVVSSCSFLKVVHVPFCCNLLMRAV